MHHGQSRMKAKKRKITKIGGKFINFVKIGGICNMHHWLRGWTLLVMKSHLLYNYIQML